MTTTTPLKRCATIGCAESAAHNMVYLDPMNGADYVCTECAESYARRPALKVRVEPLTAWRNQ